MDPAQVDSTETVPGDACESMVVVLVDVGIEGGIQVDVVPFSTSLQAVFHGFISQPLFQFGRSDHIVNDTLRSGREDAFRSSLAYLKQYTFFLTVQLHPTNLDIIGGQDASQIEHLQHGGGAVIGDAVALKHIFCDKHLPGQPALSKSSIKGQNVRQVARLATTAAFVFLYPFSDSLHFPLLAVSSC